MAGGARAMARLLDVDEPPTAVFAFSDEMAYGAIRVMTERGLPGRTSRSSATTATRCRSCSTSARSACPFEEIGATAARSLLEDIHGRTQRPGTTMLPTQLIARGTT